MDFSQSLLKNSYTKKGAVYGLLGTPFIPIIMLIGMGTGMSPIPEPIPAAIAKGLLGNAPKIKINKKYWIIFTASIFIFLLSWPIIPQQLSGAIIPILLLLGYRCVMRVRLWH